MGVSVWLSQLEGSTMDLFDRKRNPFTDFYISTDDVILVGGYIEMYETLSHYFEKVVSSDK